MLQHFYIKRTRMRVVLAVVLASSLAAAAKVVNENVSMTLADNAVRVCSGVVLIHTEVLLQTSNTFSYFELP